MRVFWEKTSISLDKVVHIYFLLDLSADSFGSGDGKSIIGATSVSNDSFCFPKNVDFLSGNRSQFPGRELVQTEELGLSPKTSIVANRRGSGKAGGRRVSSRRTKVANSVWRML